MDKKNKVEIIVDPENSGWNFWGTRVLFPFVKAYTSNGLRIDPSDWIAEPVGQPDAIYMSEEDFFVFYLKLTMSFDDIPLCINGAPICQEEGCDDFATDHLGDEIGYVCWDCYREYQG